MATSDATPLFRTPPKEPVGERSYQTTGEKPRKAPVRNVTQPEGTFAYTVDKNDTLSSIAARFETTPSELTKINRLVSRIICPGKVIFVPEKSVDNDKNAAERQSSPTKDIGQQPDNLKAESPPSDGLVQCSPKPGRAERIANNSPSPPYHHSSMVKILSKEEEQKLDQECIERFLKINGVKHITDGQGVVSGVLLVTPNAAMFEPSVMETLVSERGIDKYHVSAPLQNVANAALYTDIAHMKVRHAPVQMMSLPPPEIYFPKRGGGHPYKSQGSSETDGGGGSDESPGGLPRRSESQQAVKGSVSDKADLELSEEDDEDQEEDEDSIGSCRSESKGSERSASSEVFADGVPDATDSRNVLDGGPERQHKAAKTRAGGDRKNADGSGSGSGSGSVVRFSDLDYITKASPPPQQQQSNLNFEINAGVRGSDDHRMMNSDPNVRTTTSAQSPQPGFGCPKKSVTDFGRSSSKPRAIGLMNGRASFPDGAEALPPKESRRGPFQIPTLPDSLWPMSQSFPGAKSEAPEPTVVTRKHSVDEAPRSAEKALKRLSYPIAGSEAAAKDSAASKDSAAPLDLAAAATAAMPPPLVQGQNAFKRILNSPRHLVDFSTGLFQWNTNEVSKTEDISQFQRQMSYSLPTPLPAADGDPSGGAGTNHFFGERRGSSPDGAACIVDAKNAHVELGRRFSADGSSAHRVQGVVIKSRGSGGGHHHPGTSSREDIRIEFKSEVTLEDKKDLFQNIDEIVPVPARSCDDPPLYLCLRMGRPVKAPSPTAANGRHERRPKKPLKSEYWFSIPKDRVDELYHFIEQWAPGAYGSLEDTDPKDRGLELISSDELSDDEQDGSGIGGAARTTAAAAGSSSSADAVTDALRRKLGSLETNPDWEVVSISDVRENRLSNMSFDLELPLPELIGDSEILTEEHRREIFRVLPARAEGYSWSLIFSAAEHGFSLQSMYRRMAKYESPVLLIIQDTENNVFGAMMSCILKTSDHFYGTGESFLFTFHPTFKTFKWTGENEFFIKGNPDCLAIGAGDGLFGLWLDGDLYHGRSHRCKTYNNDTLSNNEDFCIKMLEAWGFIDFGLVDSSLC